MKITIDDSPKEVAKLVKALLNGAEPTAKKPYFPPLLTELAENEKINELAEAVRNADEENAPQVEAAEQDITFESIKPRFEACINRIKEVNLDV